MKILTLVAATFVSLFLHAGEPAAVKPDAPTLLKSSQTFCASLNTLACEIDLVRTALSPGKTSERFAHFDVALQRPNLLSILLKDEGTVHYAWISDGKDVYTYITGVDKFSKKEAPAAIADLFASTEMRVVRNTLEGAFLLDHLLAGATPGKLPFNATSAEYVALEDIGTDKAHHLRIRRAPSDWDLWIADGPAPLPLKVSGDITATIDPPQAGLSVKFVVTFKRWLPGAELNKSAFKFDPSSSAKRVGGFLPDIPPHPLLNKPAPAATLQLSTGRTTTLAAHRGRDVVVLDFWAISCIPCIGLLPKVDFVAKKYAGQNVAFYAMNENDSAADIREFFAAKGLSLPVTLNNKSENFARFKVDAIPQTFVIDKNGTIRAAHSVHSNDLAAELIQLIDTLK